MTAASWADTRRHLRAVRRSRAPSLGARLSTAYEWLLYLVVGGGVVVAAVRAALDELVAPPVGIGNWLAWCAGAAAVAAAVLVARAIGPLVVGAPEATWLLSAPLDRAQFLAGRYLLVVLLGAVLGGVCAVLLAGLPGIAAGTTAGVVVAAGSVATQARPRAGRIVRITALGVLVVAWAATAAVLLGVLDVPVAPVPPPVLLTVLALLAVPAVVAGWRSLRLLDHRALTGGAPVLAAVTVGTTMLDGSLIAGVAEERRLLRVGRVRSRRLPGRRWGALLAADALRNLRSVSAGGTAVGVAVVPYLAALMAPPVVVPVVQLAACCVVAARFAGGLRSVARSAALRRALGGDDRGLLAVHCAVPLAAAGVAAAAVGAAGGTTLSVALLPASAVLVTVRLATRPPRDATFTLLETGFGAVPVELVRDLSRGVALFAVLALVQVLCG